MSTFGASTYGDGNFSGSVSDGVFGWSTFGSSNYGGATSVNYDAGSLTATASDPTTASEVSRASDTAGLTGTAAAAQSAGGITTTVDPGTSPVAFGAGTFSSNPYGGTGESIVTAALAATVAGDIGRQTDIGSVTTTAAAARTASEISRQVDIGSITLTAATPNSAGGIVRKVDGGSLTATASTPLVASAAPILDRRRVAAARAALVAVAAGDSNKRNVAPGDIHGFDD